MSWKPEVQTRGDEKFYSNNLAFETKEEAEASAKDLFKRWMLATAWRAVESDQVVNYKIVDSIQLPVIAGPTKKYATEGDICGLDGCEGHFYLPPVENCTCFISPPCNACVTNDFVCDACGLTITEYNTAAQGEDHAGA